MWGFDLGQWCWWLTSLIRSFYFPLRLACPDVVWRGRGPFRRKWARQIQMKCPPVPRGVFLWAMSVFINLMGLGGRKKNEERRNLFLKWKPNMVKKKLPVRSLSHQPPVKVHISKQHTGDKNHIGKREIETILVFYRARRIHIIYSFGNVYFPYHIIWFYIILMCDIWIISKAHIQTKAMSTYSFEMSQSLGKFTLSKTSWLLVIWEEKKSHWMFWVFYFRLQMSNN